MKHLLIYCIRLILRWLMVESLLRIVYGSTSKLTLACPACSFAFPTSRRWPMATISISSTIRIRTRIRAPYKTRSSLGPYVTISLEHNARNSICLRYWMFNSYRNLFRHFHHHSHCLRRISKKLECNSRFGTWIHHCRILYSWKILMLQENRWPDWRPIIR